jgi:hypothetical protein
MITANHDRLKLCQDREVPEWAQRLSQQIIKETGYNPEKGDIKDQLYYFFPGMPVATRADIISHGLCLFPCYPYTFAMIPFFTLVTPDQGHRILTCLAQGGYSPPVSGGLFNLFQMTQQEEDVLSLEDSGSEYFDPLDTSHRRSSLMTLVPLRFPL